MNLNLVFCALKVSGTIIQSNSPNGGQIIVRIVILRLFPVETQPQEG